MFIVEDNIGHKWERRVLYRCGLWIVHRAVGTDQHFTVTHEPTKRAAVKNIPTLTHAKEAARALSRIPGNWDVTDHLALSQRQVRAGKQVRRAYEWRS